MASVGAIAGGFALFWTIAAILLGIAIVILSVIVALRGSARPSVQPA
jgi:ABC-type tungstate transport system substrate-binding protein